MIRSTKEMQSFARDVAKQLLGAKPRQHAMVIGLVGDLGAGKTTFAQGFAKALGIRRRMLSPTFIIFRRYAISDLRFAGFFHVDVYRIKEPRELLTFGFKKIFADPRNIVLIEWADKVRDLLPHDTLWLRFEHGLSLTERVVSDSLG